MKEADGKLKTSFSLAPAMETTILDRQMSTDSGMFDNPFRDGGEVSKDAENILEAYRQGKLSVISVDGYRLSQIEDELDSPGRDNSNANTTAALNNHPNSTELNSSDLNDSILRDRKNGISKKDKPGIVEVQHSHVPNAKKEEAEKINIPDKDKKGKGCCLIM